MRRFHVIIPARYAAQRLPGKPLLEIGGKPVIQHVVECARRSAARSVTVATDDARVERAVKAFGGDAVMTSPEHVCGTDRIAEAVEKLAFSDSEIIVNVQGDEPQMPPALLNQTAELLARQPLAALATLSAPLDNAAQLTDPAVVKVVTDRAGYALYFSRAAIPWLRAETSSKLAEGAVGAVRRHLGLYAYYCDYLRRFAKRNACELEQHEKLEQLRALWHGEKIACAEAVETPAPGLDTPADLKRIQRAMETAGGS